MNTVFAINGICGEGLKFTVDGFRAVYVIIALYMWALTAMLSPEYFKHYTNKVRYYVFFVITLFALLGVFLSADLFTTFVFFEIMSFTSYVWVAQDERKESLRAAATYLAIAVIGGLVMLFGIMLLYAGGYDRYLTCFLIFFGFAAKAGVFPLHIWLPKAHPVAPAPASALLSGILTKSGIYGILILSFDMMMGDMIWGRVMLILGLITMVLGAVLAIFSIDLKRTLACSSMSQIGFIMTGIGMGTMEGAEGVLARYGSFLHMVNHSLFKLVLFMAAGVIYMNIHELDLNRIRGFGRNKNLLKAVFLTGALGIGGIPCFSGYISKTLIHEGILEGMYISSLNIRLTEWIFLFSGGCTVAYMLKLFVAIFVEKNKDEDLQRRYDEKKKGYIGVLSFAALIISVIPVILLGIYPHGTMDRIALLGNSFLKTEGFEHTIEYFGLENLKGALISVTIGALIYFLIIRKIMMKNGEYTDLWNKKLDLEDLIYRPVLLTAIPFVGTFLCRIADRMVDFTVFVLRKTLYSDRAIPREFAEGTTFTHILGEALDRRYYSLKGKDLEPVKTYEHRIALLDYRREENMNIISRSLSFGLALVSIGLLFTLGYLLLFLLR